MDRQNWEASHYIDLGFSPSWDLIPSVRRFVTTFYDRFLDPDIASRIALATHELLENAVKYSQSPAAWVYVGVKNRGDEGVMIQVRSRSTSDNLDKLKVAFERMHKATDSMVFYTQLMREAATRNEGSGLGLARVWAEADFELDLKTEGDQVTITAFGKPTAPAGSTPS